MSVYTRLVSLVYRDKTDQSTDDSSRLLIAFGSRIERAVECGKEKPFSVYPDDTIAIMSTISIATTPTSSIHMRVGNIGGIGGGTEGVGSIA